MLTTQNRERTRQVQPQAAKDFIEAYQKQHPNFVPIKLTKRGALLGEGATGQVSHYESATKQENIVVKFYKTEDELEQESLAYQTMTSLTSPPFTQIPRFYGPVLVPVTDRRWLGDAIERPCLPCEFGLAFRHQEGPLLYDVIGMFDAQELHTLERQVETSLKRLHGNFGIVQGDIREYNIIMGPNKAEKDWVFIDFAFCEFRSELDSAEWEKKFRWDLEDVAYLFKQARTRLALRGSSLEER